MKWNKIDEVEPPQRVVVNTKIDDHDGIRNEQPLKKVGNLWWTPNGGMYVYYTPTHWQPLNN